jgi:ATPase subunit of ABC transporter with duplicated ATPase domains
MVITHTARTTLCGFVKQKEFLWQREDKERKAMEQAQKKAEAEANRQRAKDQKAADKEQKVVEKARQKAEKEADKQRKQAEKAKQTARKRKLDELTVDENTDPAVAQAPKHPRPSRPRPSPCPNVLVPTITGGPADLPNDIAAQYATVPNHTMASVMLNVDNAPSKTTGNEMVLDPVLVNQL